MIYRISNALQVSIDLDRQSSISLYEVLWLFWGFVFRFVTLLGLGGVVERQVLQIGVLIKLIFSMGYVVTCVW